MGSALWSNICFMLGGIALLMFGMRIMGSNLEQVAGNNLKNMLGKVTGNRFSGVLAGAGVTAIINSSTATTVMLVGFVNVGLLTLAQATSVIMGANIGTTITALILASTGSGFEVEAVAALISAIGIVLILFFKKDKINKIGFILIGIGMIFIGLKVMSLSVHRIIYEGEELRPFFKDIFQGNIFPLLLVLIGIVLTALVHSSAAITGILIALSGALRFDSAVFIILGSNIGTCITSLVSSIGTNVNARRTAIIHLLFNCFGCLICIIPIWACKDAFANFMETAIPSPEWRIALFHLGFNLITTAILLPFINVLVKLVTLIVKEKPTQEDKHRLTYIDDRLLETPPIAVANTKKEILKMAGYAKENINLSLDMLLDNEVDNEELIRDNEDALNFFNRSITAFLTELIGKQISQRDEKILGSYYHVVSDIERVGDYCENVLEYTQKLRSENLQFSEEAKSEIRDLQEKLNDLYINGLYAFTNLDYSALDSVDKIEKSVDLLCADLEVRHIDRLKKGLCTAQVGSVYLQTVSDLERIGDHITNVGYSIRHYRKR